MPEEVEIDGKHLELDIGDDKMSTEDNDTNKLHVVKLTDMPRDGIGDPEFENKPSKSDPMGSGWGLKGCEWSKMSFGRRSLYQLERLCYICGAASRFYWPGNGGGGAGCRGLVWAIQVLVLAGCVYPGFSRASERNGNTYSIIRDKTEIGPHFLKKLSNYTVRVGSDVTFTCQVENISNYKVAWLHSEKGIIAVFPDMVAHNDRISSTYDKRDSWFLIIRGVQESDAGKYICQLNTENPISISGSLSVVVPPNIIDESSSSDTLATEGRAVTLNCDATGTPKPTITWRREDGENIRLCEHGLARDRYYKEEDKCQEVEDFVGDSLTLTNINRFQSGVYLCIGKNNVPPSVSKRVRLYVDFPPTLWITHQLVGVELGGVATIECLTAAHPKSLNFWHDKDDQFINQRNDKYISTVVEGSPSYYNSLMRLQILNVTQEDLGKYSCKAKNSLGETDGEITLYDLDDDSLDSHNQKRRENRRREKERRRKDRERRRKLEQLYERGDSDTFSSSSFHHGGTSLLQSCFTALLLFGTFQLRSFLL
eukprot:TRINITY_DN32420_c0_g1_i2.p1 TRINITY_DN32420_c0_g1~~TRINITY_DN32420_c0_g1_i2.p1  ORF type:complete len:539 (-),score=85.14 TRINITY_DN32420_c0_g1_i2:272-1888(-)